MPKRRRPSVKNMRRRVHHSKEHRGQTGKYGSIFKEELPEWSVSAAEHEICLIPFNAECKENSVFRRNSKLNDPFTEEELEKGDTFDHKLTVLIHGNVGINEDSVLCLRTINERCPVCEYVDQLVKEDPEGNKKRISRLQPRKKALYNIVCFDSDKERNKGVQVWQAPHQSIEDVLSDLATKQNRRTGEYEYKDYELPEQNWNVVFERIGTGLSTEYVSVDIVDRREIDEFKEKELDELYEQAYNFEDLIEIKTPEELREMLGEDVGEEEPNRSRGRDRSTSSEDEGRGRDRNRDRGRRDREERGRERDRGGSRGGDDNGDKGDGKPDCFGHDCNKLDKCEKCDQDMFDECYAAMNSSRRGR